MPDITTQLTLQTEDPADVISRAVAFSATAKNAPGGGVQDIPTTAGGTALAFASVASEGLIFLENLDGTNFIDIGPDSGGSIVPAIRLEAGQSCFVWSKPGITWRALADTATVRLDARCWDR